ncbi:MAG: ribosomal protein L7/L12 [Archangium sp.]|nr:ribosomal protein L7/L12 [Archangium sp.]
MTVFVIIGVVALVAVGGLILLLAAKNNVTVVDAPRLRPPSGVVTPPPAGLGGIVELLRAGQKIEAIKQYRQLTGVGLKESKDAVEAMERGEAAPVVPTAPAPASSVQALLREGRKIEAIKLYREQTGLGLKEAKDAVEAMEQGAQALAPPPLQTPPRTITSEMAVDDAELRGHLTSGRLIEAIKRYRELTGLGLKESKDAIESLRDSLKS